MNSLRHWPRSVRAASVAASVFLLLSAVSGAETANADSTITYPKKMPSRETWEKIVSFPGDVAYAPVRYTIRGLGYGGVYLLEKDVIQRVMTFFYRTGIAPVYAVRTGVGLKYVERGLFTRNTALVFTASTWNDWRQLYRVQWVNVRLFDDVYSDYALRYRSLTDERFYGVGPSTTEETESIYAVQDALFEITLRKDLNRSLSTRLDVGLSNTSAFDAKEAEPKVSDTYDAESLPGFTESVQLQGFEYSLRLDDTDRSGHPRAGRLGKLSATLFTDVKDNRYSFWKYSIDVTQHVHLIYDRVFALRIAAETTEDLGKPDIPFYHLAELGSYETIRGFTRGRFRDRDYLLGSAEYRYPIWIPWAKVVDAAAFVDAGQVAEDIWKDAAVPDLQVGYGGGFRFYSAAGLIGKIEIAFSKEGYQLYLTLNS